MNYIDAEIIKNGKSYKISDNELTGTSLEVLSFIIGGISKKSYRTEIEGRGVVNYGYDYMTRKITLIVQAKADYGHDVAHLRDCINELFDGQYYIREMRNNYNTVHYETIGSKAGDMTLISSEYVDGKQYYVESLSEITIDDQKHINEFSIELTTVDLPYAQTRYTTMQLNAQTYDENTDLHGTADNIDFDNTRYAFTTNEFKVFNAGNVTVQPESMYLKITVKGVSASSGFSIKNLTTGKTFKVNKAVSGTLILDGINIKLNNISILRDTNLTFIDIAPGLNNFSITGGKLSSIEFDFKYYYK